MKIKFLLFGVIFAMTGFIVHADQISVEDSMYVNDFTAKAGDTVTVDVLFFNTTAYSAIQDVIFTDENINIIPTFDDGSDVAWLDPVGRSVSNPRALVSYTTNAILADPNKHVSHELRLVGVQMRNKAVFSIVTQGEPIYQIRLAIPQNTPTGVFPCKIVNQRYSTGIPNDNTTRVGKNSTFYITVDGTTGVKDVNAAKEVAGVKYFNIAGMESSEPFQGMNIVVTSYTDGTQSTAKVMK